MSAQHVSDQDFAADHPEEMNRALFAHLVMQQSNMALMLLGKAPHPESGKTVRDLEAAKLFIDLLEMLEAKTKGNLSKEESALLKQTLMTLRLSFVEAVESAPAQNQEQPKAASSVSKPAEPVEAAKVAPSSTAASEGEEHQKKFTKKY